MENTIPTHFAEKDNLKAGLWFSFALHALILSFFFLRAAFFPTEPIVLGEAIKVDLIALPDKVDAGEPTPQVNPEPTPIDPELKKLPEKNVTPEISPPKPPPPKPKETQIPQPKSKTIPDSDAINLEKAKAKQDSALKRLKAQSALEEISKEVKAEAAANAARRSKDHSTKIKGNIISPGTSLNGLDRLQHDGYITLLDQKIKSNWYLPEWLTKKNLKAIVRVRIDSKGAIISRQMVSSSGNTSYDDSVLSTIDRSAPFPIPPEKFVDILSIDGFNVGFPE